LKSMNAFPWVMSPLQTCYCAFQKAFLQVSSALWGPATLMYHPTGTQFMIMLTDIICCSVGAHVRDAAAYVCWAFARAYTAADMLESIAVLAPALLVTACYDREVSFGYVSAIQFTSLQSSATAAAASSSQAPACAFCKDGASWTDLLQLSVRPCFPD